MSEPKKLPLVVLAQMQAAQLRMQNAQLQFDLLCARIEKAFGVNLQNANVAEDGTVNEAPAAPPPPPPPEGAGM